MRRISWIVTVPIALVLIIFAVSNRQGAQIDLFPLAFVVEMPLFLIVLAALAIGFLFGLLAAWLAGGRQRSRARRARAEAETMARENERLKSEAAASKTPQRASEPNKLPVAASS